jgi:hypothetical protein
MCKIPATAYSAIASVSPTPREVVTTTRLPHRSPMSRLLAPAGRCRSISHGGKRAASDLAHHKGSDLPSRLATASTAAGALSEGRPVV